MNVITICFVPAPGHLRAIVQFEGLSASFPPCPTGFFSVLSLNHKDSSQK